MDQQQYLQYVNAMLNKCFGMMTDPDKLYIILPFGLGDLLISGGLTHAILPKFGKKSAVLILQERFRSIDVNFDGVSDKKYLSYQELMSVLYYVNATRQFFGANFIYGHFHQDASNKIIWNENIPFIDRYKENVYDLPPDTPFHPPIVKDISDDVKLRLHRDYVADKARTIILAPYANSTPLLNHDFWQKLVEYLNRNGYILYTNVGVNCLGIMEQPLFGTRPLGEKLNELFYLADKVKCVIGLRSGLFDLIAFAKSNIICLSRQKHFHYDDLKLNFPQSPSKIRTLYFDFEFFQKINALLKEHDVSGMQIGDIKHKFIPDGNIFWSEDSLLAAIIRAVEE